MESEDKVRQERASLLKLDDSFKKIIVIGEECPVTRDEMGITTMGIYDFLLNKNSLDLWFYSKTVWQMHAIFE